MSDESGQGSTEHGLCLYWYETKAGEEPRISWGQLAGAMHRLVALKQEFQALGRQRGIDSALRHLELCVESYMLRAFEVRERALNLLASQTSGSKKDVQRLRHPKQRGDALFRLRSVEPELTIGVECLLLLLDEDVGLRNIHTHKFYLSLGLNTGSDIFDPCDALLDFSNDGVSHAKFKTLLRSEVRRMAERYIKKAEELHKAIEKLLKVADRF